MARRFTLPGHLRFWKMVLLTWLLGRYIASHDNKECGHVR